MRYGYLYASVKKYTTVLVKTILMSQERIDRTASLIVCFTHFSGLTYVHIFHILLFIS